MAKGMLVHSETEQVKWAGGEVVTTLSIAIAREMSPRFTLVVMHVAPDNHVLVDTIHVSVNLHYSSRVSVSLWLYPSLNLTFIGREASVGVARGENEGRRKRKEENKR